MTSLQLSMGKGVLAANQKRSRSGRSTRLSVLTAMFAAGLSACMIPTRTEAASGTWVQDSASPQNWSNASNWSAGIADGAGFIADFSTLNIANNNNVVLDSSRTIGELLFQDKTTSSNTWTLSNSGGAVLTLDSNGVSFETGSTQPRIQVLNQTATISSVLAGTNGFLATGGNATLQISGANTSLSGVITLHSTSGTGNQFTFRLSNSNALGSASVFSDPGTSNNLRIMLDSGVNIANNITIQTNRTNSGGNGTLTTNGDVSATFSGTITVNGVNAQGGEFNGPGEGTFNPAGQYLSLTGAINLTLPSTAQGLAGGAGNGLTQRGGNVRYSGGGSYFRLENRSGVTQLGANNGLATNAYLDLGGNSNGNPQNYSVFDLAGFNQQLIGISNFTTNTFAATVTNSSTATPATLTLTPGLGGDPNQANLAFTSGNTGSGTNATITDASASAPLSLTVGHLTGGVPDANGTQYILSSNSSYRGVTKLVSGVLAVSTLANGGSNSSIGASSNAATNLVFGQAGAATGGTLRYVNSYVNAASNTTFTIANSAAPSTDRNFTITDGSSGTIDVASAGTTLTWSGASANTTGVLNKAGAGTLILSGSNAHTGGTNVNAGTLLLTGSLSTGTVAVANLATLGGAGTISGTLQPGSGGIVAPGVPGTNNGIGTLNVGGLVLNNGAQLKFEITDTTTLDKINDTGAATFNGGTIFLFQPGTTQQFIAPAGMNTYPLFSVTGAITGSASALTIANPQAGRSYNFSGTSLVIGDATTREWNNGTANGIWSNSGNWIGNNVPNAAGVFAKFGTATGAGSVDLNGSKTVAGLIFDNGGSYNLMSSSGTDTLTLDNVAAVALVDVNNGSHSISVPVVLPKGLTITTANSGAALTFNNAITGSTAPIIATGPGTVTFANSSANTFTTVALSGGGALNVGNGGSVGTLGSGDLTISGASSLNFNRTGSYNFGGSIVGSGASAGSVNQLGTGTTTIAGAINNVTSVNVSAGTLIASSTINQTGGLNVTGIGGLGNTGSGSLTANGSISGAGALNVDTSGTVNLNASNSYTGATSIANGTVVLGAVGALPANSALTVNGNGTTGGTLDVNAKNISVSSVAGTAVGGVITNNGNGASTSTMTLNGAASSYDLYAALNDGVSGGKMALVTGITNNASGNIFVLHLHATGTYSGGTTVNSQSIEADANNAFGTGPITITANNASTNSSQILLASGVSIGNNITVGQGNPHPINGTIPEGVIQPSTPATPSGDSTVTGTITINANNTNDGLFNGPAIGAGFYLNVQGAVNVANTANTVTQIGGQVKYFAGGNYPNMIIQGLTQLGATNGLSQTAALSFSTAVPVITNGVPEALTPGTLDLGGFDQTVTSIACTNAASTIQNSIGGPNTLTLNTSGTTSFNGMITGNLNLTVQGTGVQQLPGITNSYTGVTTIGGTATLEATSLADGGGSLGTSIAASNLVFNGGTLRYVGTEAAVATSRGFTINNGTTATIDVNNALTNLTLSGSSVTSGGTAGNFKKAGPGILTLAVGTTHAYTGTTTVSAGTLVVNTALSNTAAINILSAGKLSGTGSIAGSLVHTAGTINPGDPAVSNGIGTLTFTGAMTLNGGTVQYDVDSNGNVFAPAQDLVNANGGLSIAGASTIDLELLNPSAPPTAPFDFRLFNYIGAAVTAGQAANLNFISDLTGRSAYTVSVATPGVVSVHVVPGPSASLRWNSPTSGSSVWDVNMTANWFNLGTSSTDKYSNGDAVEFADGSFQTNITLNTTASNSSISVTSNTNNYTISGTGKISGLANLTMSGGSTLTMKTNNDYSGATTISSGTVDVGGSSTSGSLGIGTIHSNSHLKFTRTDGNAITPLTFVNTIDGTGDLNLHFSGSASITGTVTQASILNNGSGTATLTSPVDVTGPTMAGGVTISAGSLNISGSLTFGSAGVTVSNAATSVLSGGVQGSGGIAISGTGFVTVGGLSSYSGNTVISGGTFFTNDQSALGNTVGTTTVNSPGSLFCVAQNANYGAEVITINGTGTANNGSLHVGGATTSTFENTITLGSDSLINLDGGATLALTAATNGTSLNGAHALSLAGGGTLSIGGLVTGVTSINTGTTGSVLAFAPPALGTLTNSTPITGAGNVNSTTAGTPAQGSLGTTILTADNSAFIGAVNVNAGNLQVSNANQLGSAATGTINISGGAGAVNGSLLLASGSTLTLSRAVTLAGRQGGAIDVPHIENVSGNSTVSGTVTLNAGGSDLNLQSDAGSLTIQSGISAAALPAGARNLKLLGAGNGALNGVLADIAANPMTLVKSGAGTWTLGATSALNGGLTLNDTGTLAVSGAHNETFAGVLNVNSGTPHLDVGTGASTIRLANSSAQAWAGTSLGISNWTYGTDHFQVGTDNTGLASNQLSSINFDHFQPGASIHTIGGFGEVTPIVGNVNQDSAINIADVGSLMVGLANSATLQQQIAVAHPGFTASDTKFVMDVNLDGSADNKDLQAEIVGLANGGAFAPGGGSLTAVPEPGAIVLFALGGILLAAGRIRSRRS